MAEAFGFPPTCLIVKILLGPRSTGNSTLYFAAQRSIAEQLALNTLVLGEARWGNSLSGVS